MAESVTKPVLSPLPTPRHTARAATKASAPAVEPASPVTAVSAPRAAANTTPRTRRAPVATTEAATVSAPAEVEKPRAKRASKPAPSAAVVDALKPSKPQPAPITPLHAVEAAPPAAKPRTSRRAVVVRGWTEPPVATPPASAAVEPAVDAAKPRRRQVWPARTEAAIARTQPPAEPINASAPSVPPVQRVRPVALAPQPVSPPKAMAQPAAAPVARESAAPTVRPNRVAAKPAARVSTAIATDLSAKFRALGLSERTLFAIEMQSFTEPTPIQVRSIPILLTGRDVVGRAQTGTGKTLAFAAPIADRIEPENNATQAIVLVPTRELAEQVATQTASICGGRGLTVVPLIGGRRIQADIAALNHRPQIVVGTPGRVIDHLRRGTLQLGDVRFVVLDEADEMLDIGFADDIETILRRTPKQRQTALFSATLPAFIKRMIARYLHNPAYVAIEPERTTLASIDQLYFEVAERDKCFALLELLESMQMTRVLCFRRTQIGVDRLANDLKRRGVSALGIHGGLNQSERDRVMKAFRAGEIRVLIATNVAARGLDIPDVTHIVNYDLPQNTEEYVHRIGRTGRAGRGGTAVTFISEWDYEALPVLQKFVGEALKQSSLKMYAR